MKNLESLSREKYSIGTKAVVPDRAGTWRATCATCEEGGTIYRERRLALDHTARNSNKTCPKCGAC